MRRAARCRHWEALQLRFQAGPAPVGNPAVEFVTTRVDRHVGVRSQVGLAVLVDEIVSEQSE
jgi:hypothetical protein